MGPGPSASIQPQATRVPWGAVGTFFVIACAISWPLFWIRDMRPAAWAAWNAPGFLKALAPAAGPATAAMVAWALFASTRPRRISLLGSSATRTLLMWAAPAFALTCRGVGADEPHLTGLAWGALLSLYGLGEELGWRGFLHEPLQPLRAPLRFLLVAVFWGAWHFTTFVRATPEATAMVMLPMAALWFAASWGLAEVVERTRAIGTAAGVHLVFNVLALFPPAVSLPVVGACAAIWWLLLRRWPADYGHAAQA